MTTTYRARFLEAKGNQLSSSITWIIDRITDDPAHPRPCVSVGKVVRGKDGKYRACWLGYRPMKRGYDTFPAAVRATLFLELAAPDNFYVYLENAE